MDTPPPRTGCASPMNRSSAALVEYARDVLGQESRALDRLAQTLGDAFVQCVRLVQECRGLTVVSGMGKAGLIGAKLSATLASTGTRSFFLHPAEAVHGDLGRICDEDVVILMSRSGTTAEVVRLLEPLKRAGAALIAMTSEPDSPVAVHADAVLDLGSVEEACPLGLAPTTSTAAMLGLGDALAMTVMRERHFSKEDFARFHPAGALGRRLLTVGEVMRDGGEEGLAIPSGTPLRQALESMTGTRAGCVAVVDPARRVLGVFTDGDLRRRLMRTDDGLAIDEHAIDAVMTPRPKTIAPEALASEAVHVMKEGQWDQILVVDGNERFVGLLDIQDLMAVGLI